jgi:hypothetical protein
MIYSKNDIFVPYFKEIYKNFILIFLFYLFLFQPPIISKYIYIGLEILVLLAYVTFPKKKCFSMPSINNFKIEFLIISIIIIYAMVRDFFAGEEVYSLRFLAWSFQSFTFGFFIISVIARYNQNRENKINIITLLYWTAFFAAIFTLLLLTNGALDNYYQSIEITNDMERYANFGFRYRGYGIAENLSFTYPYVLGFFAGYTLLVINKNILLIFPFLLFLLGVYFNARIGFIAVIIFILISFQKRFILNNFILIGLSAFIASVVYIKLPLLWSLILMNKKWVSSFFCDISYTFFSFFGIHLESLKMETSTIDTLTTKFVIFPETFWQWIFGRGESLFLKSGMNSDVGYILQFNYGGLIFSLLILAMMVFFSYRLYKVLGLKHWYFIVFVLSIFLLNFKGFIFAATPGGRLLFFLYFYFVYSRTTHKKNYRETIPGKI